MVLVLLAALASPAFAATVKTDSHIDLKKEVVTPAELENFSLAIEDTEARLIYARFLHRCLVAARTLAHAYNGDQPDLFVNPNLYSKRPASQVNAACSRLALTGDDAVVIPRDVNPELKQFAEDCDVLRRKADEFSGRVSEGKYTWEDADAEILDNLKEKYTLLQLKTLETDALTSLKIILKSK